MKIEIGGAELPGFAQSINRSVVLIVHFSIPVWVKRKLSSSIVIPVIFIGSYFKKGTRSRRASSPHVVGEGTFDLLDGASLLVLE